ncbi:MAG: hypothetical protein DDT28_00047 [Dehalococcoidia bacterium]|nr:hypothetical protein [Chloroflexota bacterium]
MISLTHFQQIYHESLTYAIVLRSHLFCQRKQALRFPQVNNDLTDIYPLDHTAQDISLPVGERSQYELVLCFAKALHNNLLGGLHADAPRIRGMNFNIDRLT